MVGILISKAKSAFKSPRVSLATGLSHPWPARFLPPRTQPQPCHASSAPTPQPQERGRPRQTLTLKPDVEGWGRPCLVGRELDANAVALTQQALERDALGWKGVVEKSGLVGQPTVDHHPGSREGEEGHWELFLGHWHTAVGWECSEHWLIPRLASWFCPSFAQISCFTL